MTVAYCPTCDRVLTPEPSRADTPDHTEPCAPCASGDGLAELYSRDMPEGKEWIPMIDGAFPETATIRTAEYKLKSSDRHKAVYRRD